MLSLHFMLLKTTENFQFSGVFRGSKIGTLAKNGLNEVIKAAKLFLYHFLFIKYSDMQGTDKETLYLNDKLHMIQPEKTYLDWDLGFRTTLSLPGKVRINMFLTIFMRSH